MEKHEIWKVYERACMDWCHVKSSFPDAFFEPYAWTKSRFYSHIAIPNTFLLKLFCCFGVRQKQGLASMFLYPVIKLMETPSSRVFVTLIVPPNGFSKHYNCFYLCVITCIWISKQIQKKSEKLLETSKATSCTLWNTYWWRLNLRRKPRNCLCVAPVCTFRARHCIANQPDSLLQRAFERVNDKDWHSSVLVRIYLVFYFRIICIMKAFSIEHSVIINARSPDRRWYSHAPNWFKGQILAN